MLCLQAECRSEFIFRAPLQSILSAHKIASVKLDAGFLGFNIHHNARLVTGNSGGVLPPRSPEHKVVVVALSEFQLLIVIVDACTYSGRLCKIEWSTCHRI